VENSPARKIPSHGTDLFGVSHAIDFVAVDSLGRSAPWRWQSIFSAEPPGIFHGFGVPLLSPVAGTVVEIHDEEPDHRARRSQVTLVPYMLGQPKRIRAGVDAVAGNRVVIALSAQGPFVVLAHLQQGSTSVREGEQVVTDQPVGRCGNSGNSTEPHVHLQVSDSTDWPRAKGVPIIFRHPSGSEWLPDTGDVVSR